MFLRSNDMMSSDLDKMISNHSNNIDNMTEGTRISLIILNCLIILAGGLGNGFVLYASMRYRAIDIDRISILLIENLAVADFLIVIIEFVPMLVTLLSNRWLLGDAICNVQSYARSVPFVAETMLITTMACYRLRVILRPPFVPIRIEWFYGVAVVAWAVPLLNFVAFFVTKPQAHFNPPQLACTISDLSDVFLKDLYLISGVVCVAVPMIITVLVNIAMLAVVFNITRRLGQTLPNRGAILTIMWVCLAFILSYAPHFTHWVLEAGGRVVAPWGIILVTYCLAINVVSNPVIYVLSNRRFKAFVMEILSHGYTVVMDTLSHAGSTVVS